MYLELDLGDNDFRTTGALAMKYLWGCIKDLTTEGGSKYSITEAYISMRDNDNLKPYIKRLMVAYDAVTSIEHNTRFVGTNPPMHLCMEPKSLSSMLESTKRLDKYLEQINLTLITKKPKHQDCNGGIILLDLKSGAVINY